MTQTGPTPTIPSANGSVELPKDTTLPPREPSEDTQHTPTTRLLSHAIGAGQNIRLTENITHARTGMGTVDAGTVCEVMVPPGGTYLVGIRPPWMEDIRRWFYVRLDEIELIGQAA